MLLSGNFKGRASARHLLNEPFPSGNLRHTFEKIGQKPSAKIPRLDAGSSSLQIYDAAFRTASYSDALIEGSFIGPAKPSISTITLSIAILRGKPAINAWRCGFPPEEPSSRLTTHIRRCGSMPSRFTRRPRNPFQMLSARRLLYRTWTSAMVRKTFQSACCWIAHIVPCGSY